MQRQLCRSLFVVFAMVGAGLMVAPPAKAQGYGILASFKAPGAGDASNPTYGTLVADPAGNLYGSTTGGGVFGSGAVFELVKSSGGYTEKTLYSFSGGANGSYADGGLAIDAQGNLYGTAAFSGPLGQGVVYELVNSSGTYSEKTLYAFSGGADGGVPSGGLVIDAHGNLYGTTNNGGTGNGTLFELVNSSGTFSEKVLVAFPGGFANFSAGLTVDGAGNFYGSTLNAGANGLGQVFELVNTAGTYTVQILHNFTNANGDGANPTMGLAVDSAGNVYGTTQFGGANGSGIVYELVNSGGTYSETVLYSFTGSTDGSSPYGGVVIDSGGNLYGATTRGGATGQGAFYELVNSAGNYTLQVLHSFDSSCAADGTSPQGILSIDASGNIYGTTNQGGANGTGTVFEFLTASGAAGPTSTSLTASVTPATAGEPVQFTASILSPSGLPLSGTVTFSEGATVLGSVGTNSGACNSSATLTIEDAESLGIGSYTVSAQYVPSGAGLASSSASLIETINEPGVALTVGGNSLTGNQTIAGTVSATTFVGNGSGLNNVSASMLNCSGCIGNSQLSFNYAGSATQGGPATSALDAMTLGGLLPTAFQPAGSYVFTSSVGVPSGVASLDTNGKVPAAQLPTTSGGSSTPAILTGWCSGAVASNNGATFGFAGLGDPTGTSGTACNNGTGASTVIGMPMTSAGTLKNLYVYPGTAGSSGTNLTVTVFKASAPGWSFTSGPNQATISSLAFSRSSDTVTLRISSGGNFVVGDQIVVSGISGTYNAGANCTALAGSLFDGTFAVSSSTSTTVAYVDHNLPTNCGSNIGGASASGSVVDNTNPTANLSTRTAPTATTLTCTISAPTVAASLVCSDASHTVAVNAGDLISVVATSTRTSGTETLANIRVSLEKQ